MKRDVRRLVVPGLVVVLALACDRQNQPYCDNLDGLARRLPEPGATHQRLVDLASAGDGGFWAVDISGRLLRLEPPERA